MDAKDHAVVENGVIKILTREAHIFGDHQYAPTDLDKLPRAQKRAIGVFEVVRGTANVATTVYTVTETAPPTLASNGDSIIIATSIKDMPIEQRRAVMEVPLWKLKIAIAESPNNLNTRVQSYLNGKPPRLVIAWEQGEKATRGMKVIQEAVNGMLLTEAEADALFERARQIEIT